MATETRRERKVVTVLFADLVGFTARAESLDPEDVAELLHGYHERLRSELERWGGTVEKFIGDAVMAVFGAPVAREDDPERAVRAALAIRDSAADDGEVEVRIAVNSGEALVTLDVRPETGEGMVAGDVVNTASRLQSAAPANGILVGEQTYRATQHVIDYREAAHVVAKGKAEPIAVWEAVEARSRFGVDVRQHGGAPLVGRTRELDVLTSALERVKQERSPQLVTVVGVPGIGKSRLVWELFRAIERGNELVFWRQGRCLPYGEGVSFWALSEMVKAQAGILESDAHEAVEEKLTRSLADLVGEPDAEWVGSHLRPLVGVAATAEPGGDRREEAFAAWRRFFESMAERRPLVIVFEDLHFADEGLLDFIDHLVEWSGGVPLLAVCTARPELLDRRSGWGGGKLNSTTLALSPLTDDDSARLVGALLDRKLLPAETQAALLDRAGGNPLYAEQFARLYLESGAIDDLPLPETLHGLIAARLDALPQEEKELLQDAAVVGKVFWAGALRRPDAESRALLHALDRKEFVRRERRPSVKREEEYAFRHLLVRDVAYGQIPRAARAEKHRGVAEWIESLGRPEDHAELVAHHYLASLELTRSAGQDIGDVAPRARAALRAAGDRSFALNAFASAVQFYEAALELWPDDAPDRAGLVFAHAYAAYAVTGSAANPLLREAAQTLLAAGEDARAAEAEVLLTESEWQVGQRDRAYEHLDRALELVAPLPASPSKAAVLSQAARFHMLGWRHDRSIELGRSALEMAERLGLEDVQAQALITIGPARMRSGDWDGVADTEAGVAIARRIGSSALARGLINLAVAHGTIGDLHRSLEVHEEAGRTAERMGQYFHRRFVRGGRATLLYQLGRWDEALSAAEAFLAEIANSPHYLAGGNLRTRALISFARGDTAGALADAERAASFARGVRDPQAVLPALGTQAELLFLADRSQEARVVAAELIEHWTSGEQDAPSPPAAFILGELFGKEKVLEILRTFPRRPFRDAAIAVLEGDFAAAAEIAAAHGDATHEAFARLRAAEKLVAEGRRSDADAQLEKALAFYRSVGATRYVREGEALLAASA